MKCAASAEIARSASANVRRLGGWPVTRGLLSGSSSASAFGWRARTRRNSPSSVGDALVWITASFGLRVRSVPPGLREISRQRSGCRPFYPIPARDPLFLKVKQWNCIETRHQGPVERPHRRDERRMLARGQHGFDHGVDGGILGAHVVPRALGVGGPAAPIKPLLVAG